jgi:hypothetical protein
MKVGHWAGRALLAAVFIHAGLCTLQDPGPRVQAARRLLARLRKKVPVLPGDETLVRANAVVHVAAACCSPSG